MPTDETPRLKIPIRPDVKAWASAVPPTERRVEHIHFNCGADKSKLGVMVFENDKTITICWYMDPPVDESYLTVPPDVADFADKEMEKWRADPRPWTVIYWDAGYGFIEAKNDDGMWNKLYFGNEDAIRKVHAEATDAVGDPMPQTLGDFGVLIKAWMRM